MLKTSYILYQDRAFAACLRADMIQRKLIVGFMIKTSIYKIRFYDVYKSGGIYLCNLFDQELCLLPGNYRIEHTGGLSCITAYSGDLSGAVVGQVGDFLIHFIWFVSNNEKSMFFIFLMKHLYHLGGSELKDDRVQCFIPSEDHACNNEDAGIARKDIIPDISPAALREKDPYDISSSAAGISNETKADAKAVDQSAKDTDKQSVIGDGRRRNDIC